MERYQRFNVEATLLVTVAMQFVAASGSAAATVATPCDVRVRIELTRDVPQPLDTRFVSSLLSTHSSYWLTLRQQDPYDPSAITADLMGPGADAGCRQVVDAMRNDARVVSVEVQGDPEDSAGPAVSAPWPIGSLEETSTEQPMGTVEAGPDGDWVLDGRNGVTYVQMAKDRYECDIWAVDKTGFDPTQDGGGVPPEVSQGKRAEYLRAEAACFQARGYVVR